MKTNIHININVNSKEAIITFGAIILITIGTLFFLVTKDIRNTLIIPLGLILLLSVIVIDQPEKTRVI